MTKPEGYEKQRNKFSGLAKILYRKYPNIAQSLVEHYRFYNETISYMNQRKQKRQLLCHSTKCTTSYKRYREK